ncbi:MAG: FAD-dependent oxidoreductase [Bacilli bacterium]
MQTIQYGNSTLPVLLEADVCVVGGGTSGVATAYAAADNGCSVVVLEKQLSLAGSMTNALVTPMMPSYVNEGAFHQTFLQDIENFDQKKLKAEGTVVFFNPETVKYVTEQQLLSKNVVLQYNCTVFDAIIENEQITHVIVQAFNKRFAVAASMFVDASGDAILAEYAGIPTVCGDEHGKNQSVSFRFEIANIDMTELRLWCKSQNYTFNPCTDDEFFEFVHVPNQPLCGNLLHIFTEAMNDGKLTKEDIRYIQGFSMPSKPGVLSFNGPQLPNEYAATDPIGLSRYVSTGRRMQRRLWLFLKENIPGFAHSYIGQEANMLGIRESRRIVGKYVLDERDYAARQVFSDSVARGDWYVDVHNDDLDVEDESFKMKYTPGEFYDIPYSSLVTYEVSNYIAVGRHISTTFKMQSSIRIQATCQDMGERAGVACSVSKKTGVALRELDGTQLKEV